MAKVRIVVIGGGFAGIAAAKGLSRADADVLVLDRTNHHLFQPLLYQVATAALAPTEIIAPIRTILRRQKNATVFLADVERVDPAMKTVHALDGAVYNYDYLILAAGARHHYFGNDAWEAFAPGLKSLHDALDIRRRFLTAFEEAEKTDDPAARASWMTFVVVGGGPTGCELAGVLPEIAKNALRPDFRRCDPSQARVVLVENSKTVLNAFPAELGVHATHDLERLGVEVLRELKATGINADGVTLSNGERITAKTVLWAAGNVASPLGKSLGLTLPRSGHVPVKDDLSIEGFPEIFVAGDMALAQSEGKTVPGLAPAAMQMGRLAARNVLARIAGQPTTAFVYKDKGSLAVLGRNRAVGMIGNFKITGFLAWAGWLFIHLMYLVGYRNRLVVLFQWAYAYFTNQRGARLISPRDR